MWDVRNVKTPLETLNLGASVWDIKVSREKRVSIASIYDGFRFSKGPLGCELNSQMLPQISEWDQFMEHQSICYASEWTGLK